MKAIFIAYNQAYYMEIVEMLEDNGCRGFTLWEEIQGRGASTGDPHMGNHAWPTLNNALLAIVDEDKVSTILGLIKEKDEATPELGIRAFVWNVDQSY